METNSSSKIPYTSQDDVFDTPVVHSSPGSSLPGSIPSFLTTNNNVNGSGSSSTSDDEAEPQYKSLENIYASCSFALFVTEPACFKEANEVAEWKASMLKEMKAIEHNHTWELVTLPEGKTPIGLKWVFKVKHNVDGSVKRFMHKPTRLHLGAAKRVLCYVAGTVDFGLWYSKSINGTMYSSKKQDVVALSSSEAEYVSVAYAACQAIWLRRMLVDFNNEQYGRTTIFYDNKATIAMKRNPAFHSRTKHIDICSHFICDLTSKGIIELKYCPINEQVVDVFTKALSQAKHDYF
ncbi:retrovirus-related pol polyprotein from transposon TNT 1-94 [Tanacetum coccineum]